MISTKSPYKNFLTIEPMKSPTLATESHLCRHLWPVLRVLRLFGSYPIFQSKGKYGFEYLSYKCPMQYFKNPMGIYTCILLVLNILVGIIFCGNLAFEGNFLSPAGFQMNNEQVSRFFQTNLDYQLSMAVLVVTVISRLVLMFSLWMNAGLLVKILNDWHAFELKFNHVFCPVGQKFEPGYRTFQKFVFGGYLGVIVVGGYVMLVYGLFPLFFFESWLSRAVVAWQSVLILVNLFIEDSKCLIMMKNLQLCYQQIRLGVDMELQLGRTVASSVNGWWELIQMTRRQSELVGEHLKCQELIALWEMIFNVTTYLFSFIYMIASGSWNFGDSTSIYLFFIAVGFCGNYFARYYVKVLTAEGFYNEEKALLNCFLDIRHHDLEIKSEVQFISNVLIARPSRISFGDYAHLEKSLLLKIFGQIITYLIVILQFVNTPKSNP